MIKSNVRHYVNKADILNTVSEYEIFTRYLGFRPTIGVAFTSPFREDRNPSFFIGNKGGFLHFHDLARPDVEGDCFHFVMRMYNVDFSEAVNIVARDFNITSSSVLKTKAAKQESIVKSKTTLIQVLPKKFTKSELAYWNDYTLSLDDLKKGDVFSPKAIYINKKKITLNSLTFCYLLGDKWKIYKPTEEKRLKWLSNIPLTSMENMENIEEATRVLVLKARKDRLIAQKYLPIYCVSTQNENKNSISPRNLDILRKKEKSIIWWDSDRTGVENCTYFNQFGIDYINTPKYLIPQGIKDLSGFAKHFGPDELIKYYNSKL